MRLINFSAFMIGFVFSSGLLVSQMVNPQKVLSFLDLFGDWDPALLLVMTTALVVYWICYFIIKPRLTKPLLSDEFKIPVNRAVDGRLLSGAVLFGIGWGLTGLCPGPAIANLTGGSLEVLLYITVMCFTMYMFQVLTIKIR